MIPALPGWLRRQRPDGVALYPSDNTQAGGIGYRERVRPLLPVRALVQELLEKHPQFKPQTVGPLEPLITAEGEYAAMVTVAGELGGQPAQRDLGYVFGDDFYAHISGVAVSREHFSRFTQAVRSLTLGDVHMLGIRRRRFLFQPPPGWQGLGRGFKTDFYPRGFPRDAGCITVWPASPLRGQTPQTLFEDLLSDDCKHGFALEQSAGPDAISGVGGLHGFAWGLTGTFRGQPRVCRDIAIFADDRFIYPLRLETLDEELWAGHRPIFVELLRTVQPIPRPADFEPEATDLLDLWA